MKNLLRLVILPTFVAFLSGCAIDDRQGYVPPKLPKSEVAVLKGVNHVIVEEVDRDRVEAQFSLFGGNKVAVTPGTHKLLVFVKAPAKGYVAVARGPAFAFDAGPHNTENFFKFICEKGHTYEFSRRSAFSTKLMVTDMNTGQKMNIESDGPD